MNSLLGTHIPGELFWVCLTFRNMANTQQKELLEASLCTQNSREKHLKMILQYLNLIPQYATVTIFSLSAYLLHTFTNMLTMKQNALLAVGDVQQKKVKICLHC